MVSPSLLLFSLLSLSSFSDALPDVIRIGGLFDRADDTEMTAFRYAVSKVNDDRETLPRARLSAQIENIPQADSFKASKKVCSLLRQGVAAIFGPHSPGTASHVQSICDAMEIPHIETRWDFQLQRGTQDYSINLYPHPSSLSRAYVDLVLSLDWKSFTILYEDNEGLIRLQELLKEAGRTRKFEFFVRQLPAHSDYRPLLKFLKQHGVTNIVLDCATEKVKEVLKQAMQVSMVTPYQNYIITTLDMQILDLQDFSHSDTNITGFRLVDPERPEVATVLREWVSGEMYLSHSSELSPDLIRERNATFLKTETALMYDAVRLFAKAIHDLDSSRDNIQIRPLLCDSDQSWSHGTSIINYMKMVDLREGLTGNIKFDATGLRTDFNLDVITLTKEGIQKIGSWHRVSGVNYTKTYNDTYSEIVRSLSNKTLIVTTALHMPYTNLKSSAESLSGNDRFEGFAIDLVYEISKILGFNYTFKLVDDGAYGSKNPKTKEWNGMIRELLDGKADMAVVDLTITYERETAVDFTMPFMNLGISILYKKPTRAAPNLFSFMSPLSLDVWIYMTTATLGVTVLLFILARFTPYEWNNPHPCIEDPEILENQFSMFNSFWFIMASLMQQGTEITPKALSTRLIAGMWWFFTLIMISSYTANLAAFLTVERMVSPIESAEDLAKQTKIKYGSLESGSTSAFFRNSKISTFQRMWTFMDSQTPSVFTKTAKEGVERVKRANGEYAYLMESTSIEYVIERECQLMQVGGLLDSKGYGIALPPHSPYRAPISNAILQLQENNVIHILKKRWWAERGGGGKCQEEDTAKSKASELTLHHVGGVFVILLSGMAISCVIAVAEFIWKSRKLAIEERASLCSEMARELKFALRCRGSHKPVRKRPPEADSSSFLPPVGSYAQYPTVQYDNYHGPSKKNEFIS